MNKRVRIKYGRVLVIHLNEETKNYVAKNKLSFTSFLIRFIVIIMILLK